MTHPCRAIALGLVALLVAGVLAACGSGTSTSTTAGEDAAAAPEEDGAALDAAPVPTVAESCMVVCAKKLAANCAKDPPASGCQASCEEEQDHPGCSRETAVLDACIAAGRVVCSVDQESTPVAPCGPETRALTECLIANPPSDAGASDS